MQSYRYACFALSTVSLLTLSGCLSPDTKGAITRFGDSTTALSGHINSIISTIEQEQSHLAVLEVSETGHPLNHLVDNPNIPKVPKATLDSYMGVLSDLKTYGEGLKELASDDNLNRIDASSKKIFDSLKAADTSMKTLATGSYQGLNADDLKVLTTAVRTIGHFGYECKREKKLKDITQRAQKVIGGIIVNLKGSFQGCAPLDLSAELYNVSEPNANRCGPWAGKYLISLHREAQDLHNGALSPNTTLFERVQLNQLAQETSIKFLGINQEFENITESLTALQKAHDAIVTGVLKENSLHRDNLVARVTEFTGEVKKTIDFHNSLKGDSK